ncbi:MAG TPA: DUF3611 family protein [Pseudonocardia sp.]|jgi:Na+-transporting methylmalonyl-CoA/oxaloacetate decarboxylase gamma subunit|nr:DUF3611 family protein [Pseudonocardia sp.]
MNAVLATARRGHPGLYGTALVMAALAVVLAAAALVDDRVLLGAPIWLKPLKFAVSFALYAGTLAWMLGQLRERAMQRTGWLLVVASAVEIAIITGQAARGRASHFNTETAQDGLLFTIMGLTIVVLWFATLAVALRFLREGARRGAARGPEHRPSPSATSAIRLGLAVALLGMLVGFLMVGQNAHAVGVPDGGPGLPLVGWSTTGGDLRVAHFLGMHALQALPLLAAALAAVTALAETARTAIVRAAAAGFVGLVALLTWQALRGQPLLEPDALTLAGLAVVLLGTAAAVLAAVRADRSALVSVAEDS